jgi:hypothetical protein
LGGRGRESTALSSVGVSTALSFCRYGISNDGKTRVLLGNFTIPQATQPRHPVPCRVEKSPPAECVPRSTLTPSHSASTEIRAQSPWRLAALVGLTRCARWLALRARDRLRWRTSARRVARTSSRSLGRTRPSSRCRFPSFAAIPPISPPSPFPIPFLHPHPLASLRFVSSQIRFRRLEKRLHQAMCACVPARVSVWVSVSARSCVRERTSVIGLRHWTAVRAEQADGSRIGLARYLRDRIPHSGRACCCQGGKCAIEKRPASYYR